MQQLIVEVEEALVAEGFSEVAPGEGGLELEGTGSLAPPDFIGSRALAREQDDGVEGGEGGEITLHGCANVAGTGEVDLFASEAVEPEERARNDSAIKEVRIASRWAELEGHGAGFGVPGFVGEVVGGKAGSVEEALVARFLEEITEAGESVTSDFGGSGEILAGIGEAVAGNSAVGGLDTGVEDPFSCLRNRLGFDGTQPKIIL